MIERYENERIKNLWGLLSKYKHWWKVEFAIIFARNYCEKGYLMLSDFVHDISKKVEITQKTVEEIARIEAKTKHDLASFVEAVRNQLPDDLKKHVHSGGVTSYDIEEPALARIMIDSVDYLKALVHDLMATLIKKAIEHKKLLMVAHTHSQHAQPYTLGIKLLGYYDDIRRSLEKLSQLQEDLKFSKISGAIGMYGDGLDLKIEEVALQELGLKPAKFSRQIILRDTIARVISELAILGSMIEKIAIDLRLASYTERRELQEPFSKTQKGSSVMPFKKNPINWEKVSGMARILRANANVAMENIATWEERDISHSSVERIILPDSFHIISHMLTCMRESLENLTVNVDQIQKNLESTLPMLLSPAISSFLIEQTKKTPDEIYRILQKTAFDFVENGGDFFELLRAHPDLKSYHLEFGLNFVKEKYFIDMFSFVDQIFERVWGSKIDPDNLPVSFYAP